MGQEDRRVSVKELVIDVLTPRVPLEIIIPRTVYDEAGGETTDFLIGVHRRGRGQQTMVKDGHLFMRDPRSIAAFIDSDLGTMLYITAAVGLLCMRGLGVSDSWWKANRLTTPNPREASAKLSGILLIILPI